MEIKNNLTMTDTIAGIILTTVTEEYNKKKLDLPVIDNNKTYIKGELLDGCVKYSLIGSLGDKINNPDIILEFTDVFNTPCICFPKFDVFIFFVSSSTLI